MRALYESFTIRTDVGGSPTEAHKRVAARRDGGLLPDWTAQGYIKSGQLHHAGIIATAELVDAFIEATASGKRKDWINPEDHHKFWAAFWSMLRKHGHDDSLRTIEPPRPRAGGRVKIVEVDLPVGPRILGPSVGYSLRTLGGRRLDPTPGLFFSREWAEQYAERHGWEVVGPP